jgi:C4-dicarboxylate-specific signal transduction histidine kinase
MARFPASRLSVPNPIGEGTASTTRVQFGLQDDIGALVAMSRRPDFPTEIELLLLRVAANQAATGLQEARFINEQNRTAEDLERRVAARTQELFAVNEELRKEMADRARTEAELSSLKDSLAADLSAMTRLHDFSTRLVATTGLQTLLEEVLTATIALQNADFGNVQLYNPETGALEILAHRGFRRDFLDHFKIVAENGAACGRVLEQLERIIIEDVTLDPGFEPHRVIAASAGFRAVQSTPLFSRSGAPLALVSTYFAQPHRPSDHELQLSDLYARQAADLIDRKRAEEALQRTKDELAHVSRVMSMGELTASIAHEVNQPLGAITTNAGTCLCWLAAVPSNVPEARNAVERIIHDAHRASEVISRIRAFVKQGDLVKTPLRVDDIVRDVATLVQGELGTHDVSLDLRCEANVLLVAGDRVQLQQVVLNLVLNAVEAMSAVFDRPRVVRLRTGPRGPGEVLVAVVDAGIGLKPGDAGRMFDAFFTTKATGMGMGLAISRSIVESHGGRLWATANPDHGATFQFVLPALNHDRQASDDDGDDLGGQ